MWIYAPGTHYGWVYRGSVEYEVCPTLLHMASLGNQTPDLLVLSPMPYPLGHMLPQVDAGQICLPSPKVLKSNRAQQSYLRHHKWQSI